MSDVLGIGGIAQAAGSVASASIQAGAVKDAARMATESANRSADLVQTRYDTTRGDLMPYQYVGQNAANIFQAKMNDYADTSTMTQGDLVNTPGYQFTLDQGLKATQNSAAARGLGVSGAALKGAAAYATGLADKTYLDQFNALQTAKNNSFNRISALAGLGENAAAMTGNNGAQAAQAAGNFLTAGASGAAAATLQGGNAAASGINGITNAFSQYQAQNALQGGGNASIYAPAQAGVNSTAGYSAENDPYNY